MSKIAKLSKFAVVLFTLFALWSVMAMPVAYADGNQPPDATQFCKDKGFAYGWYLDIDKKHIQCTNSAFAASTNDIYTIS